jgi:hypothetical protein
MGKNIEPFLATLFCPTKNVTAATPPPPIRIRIRNLSLHKKKGRATHLRRHTCAGARGAPGRARPESRAPARSAL